MTDRYVRVSGTAPDRSLWLWCPGCDDAHRITIDPPNGWTWDGNETAPTISPSLLVDYGMVRGVRTVCHSFVRAGRWDFLADSTHALAGKTVPAVPLPDWFSNSMGWVDALANEADTTEAS